MPAQLDPQPADLDELLGFQPLLYPGGRPIEAIVSYHDGRWPVYADVVNAFFSAAGKDCWTDFNYGIAESGAMLGDPQRVANATLDELKSMLTWCVRGERFCDGHHGSVIERGYILNLLQRLKVLRQHLAAAQ
ncbi:DUF6508 domain-containing protein [Pseudomonas sp. LJDD11]|uniref:DUF6508 domain-containing protein n=1 Tax=unclassified Pseudomonas TaxID=196821 RepID=UPI000696ED49|nr:MULTISPECIES: DUF6508 domain-containing protein [unclassified Pseudomonas]MCO8165597.1 DUF6508 domain-containing protein [Pseudomonas sp. 21LCFQ010]MCQ9423700.1 DUF6508 domain-containing protein [Pseudomonas sp. LJDD11]